MKCRKLNHFIYVQLKKKHKCMVDEQFNVVSPILRRGSVNKGWVGKGGGCRV